MSPSSPLQTTLRIPISMRREIILLAAALVFGLVAAPPLVWLAGSHTLGPYAGDGIGSFLAAFYRGLASGTFGYWMIAVGPYLIALLVRALVGVVRGGTAAD
ncbi:MAG: hypothetical protein ACREUT_21710 [Steroidobacteraceae bacterium]